MLCIRWKRVYPMMIQKYLAFNTWKLDNVMQESKGGSDEMNNLVISTLALVSLQGQTSSIQQSSQIWGSSNLTLMASGPNSNYLSHILNSVESVGFNVVTSSNKEVAGKRILVGVSIKGDIRKAKRGPGPRFWKEWKNCNFSQTRNQGFTIVFLDSVLG